MGTLHWPWLFAGQSNVLFDPTPLSRVFYHPHPLWADPKARDCYRLTLTCDCRLSRQDKGYVDWPTFDESPVPSA